jgi:outer membrane biosynthesis protein TonB
MLEYQRSLKARKLKAEDMPQAIKSEINNLAKLEKSLIEAEKENNTELVDELDTQFIDLDSKIADMIDDYEPPKPDPKPEKKEAKEENPNPNPDPEPKEEKSGNSGILLGALALIGVGIAAVFLGKSKK